MGRRLTLGWLVVACAACTPSALAQQTQGELAPSMASAMVASAAVAPDPGPEPEPNPYRIHLEKVALAVAEDGAGNTVPATDARALDLHGPVFPVRALDPVLYIGTLHFHHYTFPAKGVLRYAVADVALLPDGAPVYVQWGDDEGSRIDITRSLEVPR